MDAPRRNGILSPLMPSCLDHFSVYVVLAPFARHSAIRVSANGLQQSIAKVASPLPNLLVLANLPSREFPVGAEQPHTIHPIERLQRPLFLRRVLQARGRVPFATRVPKALDVAFPCGFVMNPAETLCTQPTDSGSARPSHGGSSSRISAPARWLPTFKSGFHDHILQVRFPGHRRRPLRTQRAKPTFFAFRRVWLCWRRVQFFSARKTPYGKPL